MRSEDQQGEPAPFSHSDYFKERIEQGRCRQCGHKRKHYAYRCDPCEAKRLAWVKANYGSGRAKQKCKSKRSTLR